MPKEVNANIQTTTGGGATLGATTDAAIVTDTTGSISGKLRGLVKWAFERMPASLGQKTKAASLPVTLASDEDAIALAAGAAVVGATKDAGPNQTVTRTYTASADMTTPADITPAPAAGETIVGMDILVSTDTAMGFDIQMETSGNVLAGAFLPANGIYQFTLRGMIKGDAADKKLQGHADTAGNVKITAITFSE